MRQFQRHLEMSRHAEGAKLGYHLFEHPQSLRAIAGLVSFHEHLRVPVADLREGQTVLEHSSTVERRGEVAASKRPAAAAAIPATVCGVSPPKRLCAMPGGDSCVRG